MKKSFFAIALCLSASSAWAIQPFTLPWMNHVPLRDFNSADYPGTVFVIESMEAACSYCRKNEPQVEALSERYAGNKHVMVLNLSYDQDDLDYEEWIDLFQPKHPLLKDVGKSSRRP